MRIRRHLTALLATALVATAVSLVASGSPASAATATHITGSDGASWLTRSSYQTQPGVPVYGDTLSLSVNVETDTGEQVYDGSLTVQRQLAGQSTWTTVASADSAYIYKSIKAVGNASYRVVYSGSGDYSPSSAGVVAKVQHKMDITGTSGRQAGLKGKASPKYHGKIAILKKDGKKWKKFKTIRSDKKGHFSVKLPAPRKGKFFWKLTIKSSKAFAPTTSATYYTIKY
jgi:hypothetical protein